MEGAMLQPGDWAKRWMILGPTTVLPPRLRASTREHWLSRLEIARARRAALLIIGHPKSGNTWLRTMISRIYQVRHDLPSHLVVKSDELARANAAAPRLLATNGYYSYEAVVGEALDAAAPDPELRRKPIVLLVRNPCDIAVSWYFQFTKRQSRYKREMINHFIEHPIDRHAISMWEFVRHSDIGLPFLIDYLNTWMLNFSGLERAVMIRYEELRAQPAENLQRIGALMDPPFSDAEIEEAVSFGSFENLRKLEMEGHFRHGGLNLRNANDPETYKVRRGKVGGYRDYFEPEQVAELEKLVSSRLDPRLGYGSAGAAQETSAAP
jgi:hypothetical protein